jgi:hypothetical protein
MDTHIGDLLPSIVGKLDFVWAVLNCLLIMPTLHRPRDRNYSRIAKQDTCIRWNDGACLWYLCGIGCPPFLRRGIESIQLQETPNGRRAGDWHHTRTVSNCYHQDRTICSEWIHSHPLQEQAVDTFVPNSSRLVGGAGEGSPFSGYMENDAQPDASTKWNSVVLCTGANACGKVRCLYIC